MSNAIDALLDRIAAKQRQYNEQVESPAPAPAIARAEAYFHDHAQIALPAALRALWERCDGLNYNGLYIYRVTKVEGKQFDNSLYDNNEDFRAISGDRYLTIGDADIDHFVYDRTDGGWHIADKISLYTYERYDTCEALLVAVLEKYLNMGG